MCNISAIVLGAELKKINVEKNNNLIIYQSFLASTVQINLLFISSQKPKFLIYFKDSSEYYFITRRFISCLIDILMILFCVTTIMSLNINKFKTTALKLKNFSNFMF